MTLRQGPVELKAADAAVLVYVLKLRMQLNLIRITRYSVNQHYVKLLIPYNVGAHNVRRLNIDRKSGQERQRVRRCRLAKSCTPAWKLLENRLDHWRDPVHVCS